MLGILWLTVWATVGEAFYDSDYWSTQDYDTDRMAFEWQRYIHENFSDNLRSFAEAYEREDDTEMNIATVKSRLRRLKVFQHTDRFADYDSDEGQLLPLPEGAMYCTMGRHTKVDCNHCTCVAGQLYMCTGMRCPQSPGKPENLSPTCREGKQRKIDACNYCYCHNGREFCSTKDCRHDHGHYLRESPCPEGRRRTIECNNRCICLKGEEYCTRKACPNTKHPGIPGGATSNEHGLTVCNEGQIFTKDCDYCTCVSRNWKCHKYCFKEKGKIRLLWPHCRNGTERQLDDCRYCYCRGGREYCVNKCSPQELSRNGASCIEATRYKTDECNFCFCHRGQEYCTYKQCPDLEPVESCEEGTTLPIDSCNDCTCIEGEYVCSQNICENDDRDFTFLRHGRGCEEGAVKYEECNRCECRGHEWLCSKKLCYDTESVENDESTQDDSGALLRQQNKDDSTEMQSDRKCKIGDRKRISSCNYCWCTWDRKWICSNHTCSMSSRRNLLQPEELNCTEGSKRQLDACNYCICENGTEFCTEKPCGDNPTPTIHLEPECANGPLPGPDPCNVCICVNSSIMCTNVTCIRRTIAETAAKSPCVEGKRVKMNDGCNYCICQGGVEFCTSRACLVIGKEPSKNGKCIEGDMISAGDDCNICICMAGKLSCTDNHCSERERRSASASSKSFSYLRHRKPGFEYQSHTKRKGIKILQREGVKGCRPGESFTPAFDDPKCPNTCICDRNEIMCTKRQCSNQKQSLQGNSYQPIQHLKQDMCIGNERLPSDDPCYACKCRNGNRVCVMEACFPKEYHLMEEITQDYHHNKFKGFAKKRSNFCKPFTFYSPDNNRFCRNCFCLHDGLSLCLLNLCKYSKDIPHNAPQKLNKVCTPGDIGYPTKCVTCTCSDQGMWTCTRTELALCQERDCDEKDEFQMGFQPFCAGCKCAVKEWFCSIRGKSCNDYSNVSCPMGTFIRNPNQYCSLCLCGGYKGGANMCFTESKCVRQVLSQLND